MGFKFVYKILFLLSFTSTILKAQDLKFEYITPEDGLSHSTVNCILQDKVGFMWFGTTNGLNKFDGYKLIKYYHNPADSQSIAGDEIDCILEDRQGELWIGTDRGLSHYNRDLDLFINYRYNENNSNGLSSQRIASLYEDREGRLWVGTLEGGLNCFDRKLNKFIHFLHSGSDLNSLSNNNVYAIIEDNDGNILVGTRGGGLNLLNPATNSIIRFLHNASPHSISSNDIFSMAKDEQGSIWIGTLGGGLCRINKISNEEYSFDTFKPQNSDVPRSVILALFIDQKDGVWIGTENGGLDHFNPKNYKYVNYRHDPNDPNSLNNNSIHSIYKDHTGNLWIGTYTGGVNVVKKYRKKFYTLRNIEGNPNSISYNAVKCFFEDDDGALWIGTDGGGINIWNRKANVFTHFNMFNTRMKGDAILAISEDKDKDIWLGGWESGLDIYNRKYKTFTSFSTEKFGVYNNNIFDILVDRKGRIWIAFANLGFARFDKKSGAFHLYTPLNSKLPSGWVLNLAEDNTGNLLIGHTSGFSIFNPDAETFKNYISNDKDTNSLSNNQINIIIAAHDSTIWIGTINGLNHFNPKTNKFVRLFESNGLPNDNITGLVEDKHGYIWASTANGIFRLDPISGSCRNYTLTDGLQGNCFIRNSCNETSKGEILFGGTNGFNIFDPDSLLDNPNIPPVVLTDFSIFNKSIKVNKVGSPLKRNISETHEIVLSYKQSVFSFEFVALDYTAPNLNQYSYKMEGFEDEWNYIGTKHSATYTNLNPGKYVFRVKASNNDNKWNETGTFINITITPPYWKTWWFRILCVVFILLCLSSYMSFRFRRIKSNNLLLVSLVEERTRELNEKNELLIRQTSDLNETNTILKERQQQVEEQAEELIVQKEELVRVNIELNDLNSSKDKFFSIIAHDIKTPFNSIVGYADTLKESFNEIAEGKKLQIINLLQSTAHNVNDLLENLLQWSRSQRGIIEVYPEKVRLKLQIDYILKLLRNSAEEKDLTFEFIMADEEIFVNADVRMLHTILRNLINNAIKFSHRGGIIKVLVEIVNNKAEIKIIDYGIGMSDEVLDKIFQIDSYFTREGSNKERGSGIGLILSKEFIEKHGSKIWIESKEGKGTTILFTLPVYISA